MPPEIYGRAKTASKLCSAHQGVTVGFLDVLTIRAGEPVTRRPAAAKDAPVPLRIILHHGYGGPELLLKGARAFSASQAYDIADIPGIGS